MPFDRPVVKTLAASLSTFLNSTDKRHSKNYTCSILSVG